MHFLCIKRMIWCVLYGLFTNFMLMSYVLQFTRIFTKWEISQISCDNRFKTQNIVWTLKKDIAEGWPEQGRGNGDEKAEAIAWNGEVNLVGTIVSFILTGHIRIVKGSFVSEKRNALRQPFLLQKLFAVGFPLTFLQLVPRSLWAFMITHLLILLFFKVDGTFNLLMGQRWFKDDLSSQLLIGRSKFEVESAPRLKLSQYHGTESWLSPIDSLDSWQSICKLKLEVFFVKQTLFVNALRCHFPLIRFYEIVHDYSFSKWNWGLVLRLTSS